MRECGVKEGRVREREGEVREREIGVREWGELRGSGERVE